MKRVVLLLFTVAISQGLMLHKYYFSISEINYNTENESVEIITRIFYDDLTKVMQERYDDDFELAGNYPKAKRMAFLQRYFDQKLKVTADERPLKIKYLGFKIEGDYAVNYAEAEDVARPSTLEVTNTLLQDLFADQKNVVHLKAGDETKSFLLVSKNDKAVLNL